MSGDFKASEQLEREAARWATRFVDEQHSLDEALARIDTINERLVNGEQQVRFCVVCLILASNLLFY